MKVGEQTTENVGNDHLNDLHHSSNFSWFLFPATNAEIENCIKSFQTSACGYDDISSVIIKRTANIIVTLLTHIVNLSLKVGTFLDAQKKEKNKKKKKFFEKVINYRLINFFENNDLLTDNQHGFRPFYSLHLMHII